MVPGICSHHGPLTITVFWAVLASAAVASPFQTTATTAVSIASGGNAIDSRHGLHEPATVGDTPTSRTLYLATSLVCMALLTGMLGYRVRQLERQHFGTLTLTRVLVIVLGCLAMSFVSSAAIVESGLGLSTLPVCHAAIIICLTFYVSCKAVMYVFLVERAHALRAPFMKRSRDYIWLGGMLTITCGFGSIAVCGFIWPIASLSEIDGRCRIGLPFRVTIPLLSFDVVINTLLTGIFIHLLRPLLCFDTRSNEATPSTQFVKRVRRILDRPHGRSNSLELHAMNRHSLQSIERLLWKSITGSVLVMLPTVGNLVALIPLHGQELGWICLTICAFDITWSVCVVHWLTLGSTELDGRAMIMLAEPPDSSSSASTIPPQPPSHNHTIG